MASPIPIGNPSAWLGILNRFAISQFGRWFLSDTVVPVAIVDATSVSFTATAVSPLLGTPASAGESAAPVINTRLADTLALAAGTWNFFAMLSAQEATRSMWRIRRRNAADAADVWSQMWTLGPYSSVALQLRATIGAGERLVVENMIAGTAGATWQAAIFAVPG